MNQREKILKFLKDSNLILDACEICKKLNIKRVKPYSLFGDLEKENKIIWDDDFKGWKLVN